MKSCKSLYHLNCVKLSASRIMARCLLFWIACSFSNGYAIKHEYSIDANDHCEMWLLLTDIKTKSGTFLAAQCANKPTQMETFTAAVAKRTLTFFRFSIWFVFVHNISFVFELINIYISTHLCPKRLCLENNFEFIWNLKLSFGIWKSKSSHQKFSDRLKLSNFKTRFEISNKFK